MADDGILTICFFSVDWLFAVGLWQWISGCEFRVVLSSVLALKRAAMEAGISWNQKINATGYFSH